MKIKLFLGSLVSILFVMANMTFNTATAAEKHKTQVAQAPSIEGTYKLISRKLPDGKMQGPSDVMGLLTFTKNYRNFNVIWKDAKGKFFSISIVSTYKLTATEYSETNLFYIINDQIGGKETVYDITGQTGTSPVTVENGSVKFKLPLFKEPSVVFEGNKFTATTSDFVDTWEKVQ
jgi:hypothetical protein